MTAPVATISRIGLVVVAGFAAVLPPPPALVERAYSARVYPFVQSTLTAASNRVPVALFDVGIVVVILLCLGGWWWSIRRARKARSLWPVLRGMGTTAEGAALVYLWFLSAWGLNYARPPLETVLPYDAARVTPAAVRLLAERAVAEANRTYSAAHAAGFPAIDAVPSPLLESLHEVERRLGRPRATVPAHPKRSMLSPFFRASGVSGMLAPFFLETLLNPDLTGPERPVVLAHEWAHLAGYAPESDASYVGLLAALGADAPAQYSAWLELTFEAANQLQPVTRGLVLDGLASGPRADQAAINERLTALVRPVEQMAWAGYDRMLKSQGVEEGVRSYSRVIQLVLGTNALMLQP